MATGNDYLALADWRRQVAELYAHVRQHPHPGQAWYDFRAARDALFKSHPQSPLSEQQRARFSGLPYFPYDSGWRVTGTVEEDVDQESFATQLPAEGEFRFRRIARVAFTLRGKVAALNLYWIEGYGGGLFLPFRDASNGDSSYGGGRYLYDTIKGADLHDEPGAFILDFNYAYNPSCTYNDRWVCPLPLAENRLPFAVRAGEKNWPA